MPLKPPMLGFIFCIRRTSSLPASMFTPAASYVRPCAAAAAAELLKAGWLCMCRRLCVGMHCAAGALSCCSGIWRDGGARIDSDRMGCRKSERGWHVQRLLTISHRRSCVDGLCQFVKGNSKPFRLTGPFRYAKCFHGFSSRTLIAIGVVE